MKFPIIQVNRENYLNNHLIFETVEKDNNIHNLIEYYNNTVKQIFKPSKQLLFKLKLGLIIYALFHNLNVIFNGISFDPKIFSKLYKSLIKEEKGKLKILEIFHKIDLNTIKDIEFLLEYLHTLIEKNNIENENELNIKNIFELIPNLKYEKIDLNDLYSLLLEKKYKKERGIFYTPKDIVKQVLSQGMKQYLTNFGYELENEKTLTQFLNIFSHHNSEQKGTLKILDPSCGTGNFLELLVDGIIKSRDIKNNIIPRKCQVYGIDTDNIAILICKYRLLECFWYRKINYTNLKSFELKLYVNDFLLEIPNFPKKFSLVIGNPPFIRHSKMETSFGDKYKLTLQQRYPNLGNSSDYSSYFIKKSIDSLDDGGVNCFVTTNKWIFAKYGSKLRNYIIKRFQLNKLINFDKNQYFDGVTVDPLIYVISNKSNSLSDQVEYVDNANHKSKTIWIKQNKLLDKPWRIKTGQVLKILNKMEGGNKTLLQLGIQIKRGVTTGKNSVFVIDNNTKTKLIAQDVRLKNIINPILKGKEIKKYQKLEPKHWIIFTQRGFPIHDYPILQKYLMRFKEVLIPRPVHKDRIKWKGRKSGNYKWYEIQDKTEYSDLFLKPKIISRKATSSPNFTMDYSSSYLLNTSYFLASEDYRILCSLNSKAGEYYLKNKVSKLGVNIEPKKFELETFPIPDMNPAINRFLETISLSVQFLSSSNPLNGNHINKVKDFLVNKIIESLIFCAYFYKDRLFLYFNLLKKHLENKVAKTLTIKIKEYLTSFTEDELVISTEILKIVQEMQLDKELELENRKLKQLKEYHLIEAYLSK